jgi:phosphotransferase system enzyme I (PtsI)
MEDRLVESMMFKGIPASPGIAIGRAFVLDQEQPVDPTEHVTPAGIAIELERMQSALHSISEELAQAHRLAAAESATAVGIVEGYQMIVADPVLCTSMIERVKGGISAEAAVAREFDAHKALLHNARDPFLRSRVQDLDVVKERLISVLRNRTLSHAVGYDNIVVAPHVTPQDMLFFKSTQTLGYVTEVGGINSHVCILARDMGYPAVIGIKGAADKIQNGDVVVVDGYAGTVVVNPDEETLERYRRKAGRAEEYRQQLGALIGQPTVTLDGMPVSLLANVDEPENVDAALMAGAEGVGLVRTEHMLMRLGRYPSVEEQTAWYRDIAERAYPKPVTIRSFDVGSDKFRQGIPHREENPALGLRGIRFLLYRPDIFEEQVCAVLRASVHRNLRLMLPMISTLEEIDAAEKVVAGCKERLTAEGVEFDRNMPLGIMIETPAAALLADTFARHADFISIGTNDLAQYALATDRTNDLVADIFDPLHPAVIRMVRMVVGAANKYGRSVSVCGEMAGHASATEMLVGLGIRELSVTPRLLLELKRRILNVSFAQCEDLVLQLDSCATTQQVYAVLNGINAWRGKDDLIA